MPEGRAGAGAVRFESDELAGDGELPAQFTNAGAPDTSGVVGTPVWAKVTIQSCSAMAGM